MERKVSSEGARGPGGRGAGVDPRRGGVRRRMEGGEGAARCWGGVKLEAVRVGISGSFRACCWRQCVRMREAV
jgi:hypothetical protein